MIVAKSAVDVVVVSLLLPSSSMMFLVKNFLRSEMVVLETVEDKNLSLLTLDLEEYSAMLNLVSAPVRPSVSNFFVRVNDSSFFSPMR